MKKSLLARSASMTTLALGAVLFTFPFVWMLLTSFKQQEEMSPRRMQLLPRLPTPVEQSPYVDFSYYRAVETPSGVAVESWKKVLPGLEAALRIRIDAWIRRPSISPPISQMTGETERALLVNGLFAGALEAVGERLSDKTRDASQDLKDAAQKAWEATVLQEAGVIVTDEMLARISENCVRGLVLGAARLQTVDGETVAINLDGVWKVPSADPKVVTLAKAGDGTNVSYKLATGEAISLETRSGPVSFPADSLRHLYLSLRGDGSWAEVEIALTVNGQQYVSDGAIHLWNSTWREEEFQFATAGVDGFAGHAGTQKLLRRMAQTSDVEKGVILQITMRRVNLLEACLAKATMNYRRAAGEIPLVRYFATSTALVLLNVILMVFSCTLVGYAFARLEWPGRDLFFGILLATMMIPPQVTMIPNFLVIRQLGWFNTLLPLWLPSIFGAPYFIFLVRQFLKNIPKDLEDAARIDGCGFLRVYWHVMLPLVKPTVASIALFTFIASWNNFLGPLIYLNDDRLYPLSLGLFKLNISNGSEMGLLMAASLIMTLPVIITFFFLQRYFIEGLAMAGSKE